MTHQPLIEKLQVAEAGSRELDEAMAAACGWRFREGVEADGTFSCRFTPDGRNFRYPLPLTTSLDAILAEIERVFPGSDTGYLGSTAKGFRFLIEEEGADKLLNSVRAQSAHKNTTLAACIALLRAIEARDNGGMT